MHISLIAAASENNVIGNHGAIPWKLPADLKYFRNMTEGHPVLMGRKTYQSIGRPLPKRRNIVISRHDFPGKPMEFDVAHSVEEAIEMCKDDPSGEIFIIGGGEIYKQAMDLADRIYLTRVHAEVEGDAEFPVVDSGQWTVISKEDHLADPENQYAFSFVVYERIPG